MQNLDKAELDRIIRTALVEDIGAGDITSELTIPKNATADMNFIAGQELIMCGTFIPDAVFKILSGGHIKTEVDVVEGIRVETGKVLAKASGCARTLLTGERVVLNLMQRMSGVATLTHKYVEAVKGTKAIILDTRKTMPGLRALDKYAVRTGGGQNHRMRLDDMVLVKDNHLALGIGHEALGISEIIKQAREKLSSLKPNAQGLMPVVLECDTLTQVRDGLAAKPDRILLDNMNVAQLKEAVALAGGKIPLEASGGVSLETVRKIAETGVDYISVGKLTHSTPAVDIRADINIRS
jgi:nicotinate-nucleotide pyrophosphorylase (carboxylating)